MFEQTAAQLLNEQMRTELIFTLNKKLDRALDGGIPLKTITEIYGGPGSGKTQFLYQLCVNVQIPKLLNGLEGEVFFIDTTDAFNPERLRAIGKECIQKCCNSYRKHLKINSSPNISDELSFDLDNICQNINLIYTNTYLELIALIEQFKTIFLIKTKVRLIVIDSFTNLFQNHNDGDDDDDDDDNQNAHIEFTRIIHVLLTDLNNLANTFNIAIVITNELTTRFYGQNDVYFAPALGDSHLLKINHLILFERDADFKLGRFYATIKKSPVLPEIKVQFGITEAGIVDVTDLP